MKQPHFRALAWIFFCALAAPSVFSQPAPVPTPLVTPAGPKARASAKPKARKPAPFGIVHLPAGASWDKTSGHLLLPVGEAARFKSPIFPGDLPAGLEVKPAPDGFTLSARDSGSNTFHIGAPVNATVEVTSRFRAGRFPAKISLVCSTPTDPNWRRWLGRMLLGNLRPLARLSLSDLPATPTDPYRMLVSASGPDLLPYEAPVAVELVALRQPLAPSTDLVLSNRPEKVSQSAVLFNREIHPDGPVRMMIHHKLMSGDPANLELRLTNLSDAPARLVLALEMVGPSNDEIFAGHSALSRFLLPIRTGGEEAGFVLTLAPHETRLAERWPMRAGLTASGFGVLTPLTPGHGYRVELALRRPNEPWPGQEVAYESVSERTSRGCFQAQQAGSYAHRAGSPYLFVAIGDQPYVKDATTQNPNVGNFGVLEQVQFALSNPLLEAREFRLEVSARGGPARGFFLVDGHLIESGLLGAVGQVLERWILAPGEERQVHLQTLPQAGSNYPLTVTLGDYPATTPRNPSSAKDLPFLP